MTDSQEALPVNTAVDARRWTQILAPLSRSPVPRAASSSSSSRRGRLSLLWFLMWGGAAFRLFWLCLLLAVPAAGFLVRLFMIQHDCGHGAFFQPRLANDWVGRVLGVLTLTPYDFWRRTHAIHHATSGNLDRRGIGDIDTLTVREYLARSRWGRLRYRLYRHPLVHVRRRARPICSWCSTGCRSASCASGWQPWLSTMATNAAIATVVAGADLAGRRRPVPDRASADHAARAPRSASGCSMSSTSSRTPSGRKRRTGTCTRRRCTAAPITTCRACCAGSPPISACTTSIICAAASPIIGCRACCATSRTCAMSAG